MQHKNIKALFFRNARSVPGKSPYCHNRKDMKRYLILSVAALFLGITSSLGQKVITLPTASEGENYEFEQNDAFFNVSVPTMTVIPAKDTDGPAPAMLVCPGGGYLSVGKDNEGFNVANALSEKGITCFVLKYRTRPLGKTREETLSNQRSLMREIMLDSFTPQGQLAADNAYADALAAMRIIRERAEEFGIDPERIGMIGFSAGANLTMRVGLHHTEDSAPAIVAPIYLWMQKEYFVPEDAAPLFLCAPQRDLCPTDMSYKMYMEWSRKNLPAEIHVITGVGHGHGYWGGERPADIWMEYFLSFLSRVKFLR